MKLSYKKLWVKLVELDMKKTELAKKAGISSASVAKLGKGANITTDKWDDFDYLELNVIYKASKNATKFKAVLEKHRPRLIKISEKHIRPKEHTILIL